MPELQKAYQDLDMALTGKCKPEVKYPRGADQAMADNIIYLSDGGYSRIYGFFNQSDLWTYKMGSESLERAKIAWNTPEVVSVVDKICSIINKQIQELEG